MCGVSTPTLKVVWTKSASRTSLASRAIVHWRRTSTQGLRRVRSCSMKGDKADGKGGKAAGKGGKAIGKGVGSDASRSARVCTRSRLRSSAKRQRAMQLAETNCLHNRLLRMACLHGFDHAGVKKCVHQPQAEVIEIIARCELLKPFERGHSSMLEVVGVATTGNIVKKECRTHYGAPALGVRFAYRPVALSCSHRYHVSCWRVLQKSKGLLFKSCPDCKAARDAAAELMSQRGAAALKRFISDKGAIQSQWFVIEEPPQMMQAFISDWMERELSYRGCLELDGNWIDYLAMD
jgi:hypothetical protein